MIKKNNSNVSVNHWKQTYYKEQFSPYCLKRPTDLLYLYASSPLRGACQDNSHTEHACREGNSADKYLHIGNIKPMSENINLSSHHEL